MLAAGDEPLAAAGVQMVPAEVKAFALRLLTTVQSSALRTDILNA